MVENGRVSERWRCGDSKGLPSAWFWVGFVVRVILALGTQRHEGEQPQSHQPVRSFQLSH